MHRFQQLTSAFSERFNTAHFPKEPTTLYEADNYFLQIGGKRIRPVLCLMANELFGEISDDAYNAATAIELFHNFTLIHDDIMDAASLRRGMQTVHYKYGSSTALLAGDVMLVKAYDYLNNIDHKYLKKIITLFNRTAAEVCEGQQLDMDFEKIDDVSLDDYLHMITLKTSVLLAASLQMGAILGGASETDCHHLYEFGKNLGIAFQVQDDYLDAFGEPEVFGKEAGGDIKQNKKTFLLIHALERSTLEKKEQLQQLLGTNPPDKVEKVLTIFKNCNADGWSKQLKNKFLEKALQHFSAVEANNQLKEPLLQLSNYLINRDI